MLSLALALGMFSVGHTNVSTAPTFATTSHSIVQVKSLGAELDKLLSLEKEALKLESEVIEGGLAPPLTLEEKLKTLPIEMQKVAWCESGNRQFNDDGSVLRGKVNPKDSGLFQINETYHLAQALKLGFDIHAIDGNIGYAMYLYEKNGLADWRYSKSCWL